MTVGCVVWPYEIRVAGISYRVKHISEIQSDEIVCERQKDNPHDANAIAVHNVN